MSSSATPPWEKAKVDEDAFWARYYPGLRALSQGEQEAEKRVLRRIRPDLAAALESEKKKAAALARLLTKGPFPGMGKGDPDLYKGFCWRFWRLACSDGGRIGVVLPRSALAARGSTEFRLEVLRKARDLNVTMLLHKAGWVFLDAEHRYTIGLSNIERGDSVKTDVRLRGPYASHDEFLGEMASEPVQFYGSDVLSWNETASLPLLPSSNSANVFLKLRSAPRLDTNYAVLRPTDRPTDRLARTTGSRARPDKSEALLLLRNRRGAEWWRARPDAELHPTKEKPLMSFAEPPPRPGYWPVFKGASFDIWKPDTGKYYAWADPDPVLDFLQKKRWRARDNPRSVHHEFPTEYLKERGTLPCLQPRIAYRDVTRPNDTRTVRACLIPPRVFLTGKAPYFLWPPGTPAGRDEAFLLAILCSIPLDWYARRFVETSLGHFVINAFPIPRPAETDADWQRAVDLAGRLACPDERFAEWAEAVGVGCGPVPGDQRADMIHELDAVAARLYGLDERQLVHIFETFHVGWNHEPRLRAVLAHFRAASRVQV